MPRRIAVPALALVTIIFVACGGGQAAAPNDTASSQPDATVAANANGGQPSTGTGGAGGSGTGPLRA